MNEFEKFLKMVSEARSWEEKEYAMIMAIDSLPEGTSDSEKSYYWKMMLKIA